MKYSNIPNSIIAKYAHILTGIVFATTSVLPLATPLMAQTAPSLTVRAMTSTPIIVASSEVVYRIKVNNANSSTAHQVKVTSVLPTGFTYNRHLTTLQNKAVTFGPTNATSFLDPAYTNKPVAGASTLVWDKITIPANGSIEFIFAANASATASTTPYSLSSLTVDSYGSATGGTPRTTTSTTIATTDTADNVTLKPIPPTPTLTLARNAISYDEPICAMPGVQGVGVNLTGIVNTYFRPTLQTVTAGTRSIEIASGAAKGGTTRGDVTTPDDIRAGDLVLIVQMQDASIDTSNNDAYGSGNTVNQGSGQTNMGSSGSYEYAIADSTVSAANGGGTLTLKKPLINTYTSAAATTTSGQKRFQVIRVPQYASARILGTMFASPWDGNVGGILAVDTFGTFDLNGQRLSVNEAGFRGGYGPKNSGRPAITGFMARTNAYTMDTSGNILLNTDRSPQSITTLNSFGSGKGEGVAGTPRFLATKALNNVDPITKAPVWEGGFTDNRIEGYPGGDTGRGAPGNAGGGGNYHNAGGGGGGNGGNGGQGGLPWDEGTPRANKDAGGRPGSSSLTNIPTPMKVFMGGGGGGGEANDAPQGVPGGAGGGIVMLRAGTIVGTGSIFANGTNGDRGAFNSNPDGAGGGGAGGTVLVQSRNPSSATINIQAKGGNGGNTERDAFYNYTGSQAVPSSQPNANTTQISPNTNAYGPDNYVYGVTPHGPGGGGSGGIVLYNINGSSASINPQVNGGVSGLTDDPSPNATLRPRGGKTQHSNGATAGSSGQVVRFSNSDDRFADLNASTACSPANLAMVISTSTPTAKPGDVVSYKMKLTNPASSGGATEVRFENQLPQYFTYTRTNSINVSTGTVAATRSTTVDPTAGSSRPTWGTFLIPPGASVEIDFQATISRNAVDNVYRDKAYAIYPDPRRTSATPNATVTNSYGDDPLETGGDITVKRPAPLVRNFSPTIRIVRK
ncbi:DUF11 domain-containing protein [Chamaesiphon polymorphus]|nr:DUF11 domain-containing protein [Chamaesiphon polymorphus]